MESQDLLNVVCRVRQEWQRLQRGIGLAAPLLTIQGVREVGWLVKKRENGKSRATEEGEELFTGGLSAAKPCSRKICA